MLSMSDSSQPHYPHTPTPQLVEALREAEEEARALRPKETEPAGATSEREKNIDDFIEWYEGDNLDWDAIERAHYNRA